MVDVHKGAVVTKTPSKPIEKRGAKTGRDGDVRNASRQKTNATMLAQN